jgi:hypothetical protein
MTVNDSETYGHGCLVSARRQFHPVHSGKCQSRSHIHREQRIAIMIRNRLLIKNPSAASIDLRAV